VVFRVRGKWGELWKFRWGGNLTGNPGNNKESKLIIKLKSIIKLKPIIELESIIKLKSINIDFGL